MQNYLIYQRNWNAAKILIMGISPATLPCKTPKIFKSNPRQLADAIVAAMPQDAGIAALEVAGPGFINIRLGGGHDSAVLASIVKEGEHFGRHQAANPQKILLEFVSANPTGPLHVGHGRGAAYGATLANILRANGHQVDNEYYVNDAGRQMDILALSVYWRYMQHCGSHYCPATGHLSGRLRYRYRPRTLRPTGRSALPHPGKLGAATP